MHRHSREWTQEKFLRYQQEGRGQGFGKDYQPWVKVSDFSSKGRVSRIKGWKTKRMHHLMSDGEKGLFFLLEWSDRVIDIREQFPLLDIELCLNIAKDMGIEYPKNPKNGTPYILTTDFMITLDREGRCYNEARTFKPSKSLNNRRIAVKLEIERRYYNSMGIDWKIVTEKDLNNKVVANIQYIHSDRDWDGIPDLEKQDINELEKILISRIGSQTSTISQVTTNLDTEMNVKVGTCLRLFKHLVANKMILLDMTSQKSLSMLPTKSLKVNSVIK